MEQNIETRKKLLESLIRLESPIKKIISDLEPYDFNAVDDEALVVLTRTQVISALERFLAEEISAKEMYAWAAALELRDDVDFGTDADAGEVFDAISSVSTEHVLLGPLTPERAKTWLEKLLNRESDK